MSRSWSGVRVTRPMVVSPTSSSATCDGMKAGSARRKLNSYVVGPAVKRTTVVWNTSGRSAPGARNASSRPSASETVAVSWLPTLDNTHTPPCSDEVDELTVEEPVVFVDHVVGVTADRERGVVDGGHFAAELEQQRRCERVVGGRSASRPVGRLIAGLVGRFVARFAGGVDVVRGHGHVGCFGGRFILASGRRQRPAPSGCRWPLLRAASSTSRSAAARGSAITPSTRPITRGPISSVRPSLQRRYRLGRWSRATTSTTTIARSRSTG